MATTTTTTTYTASAEMWMDEGPLRWRGVTRDAGGRIVATGTPEEICRVEASHTGRYLKPLLEEAARLQG